MHPAPRWQGVSLSTNFLPLPPEVGRILEVEDSTPLIGAASIMADRPPGRDFRHAAVIPHSVLNRAFREGWFHDKAVWKRWANDPDNARFRIWQGRL